MNVATRTRYKVSKSLVVQPPSIPFCYTHTIYDLAIIVLVLEQGYICVTCCLPLDFLLLSLYYKGSSL